jgi:hypothetical protein
VLTHYGARSLPLTSARCSTPFDGLSKMMQCRSCLFPIHTGISNTFAIFQIIDIHNVLSTTLNEAFQHESNDTMITPLYLRRNIF